MFSVFYCEKKNRKTINSVLELFVLQQSKSLIFYFILFYFILHVSAKIQTNKAKKKCALCSCFSWSCASMLTIIQFLGQIASPSAECLYCICWTGITDCLWYLKSNHDQQGTRLNKLLEIRNNNKIIFWNILLEENAQKSIWWDWKKKWHSLNIYS